MDLFFIFCAKYLIYISIIAALWFFYRSPDKRKLTIFGLCSLGLAYLLAKIGGHFYYDPRPFVQGNFMPLIAHTPDNGFPSDHMLLASTLAAIIIYYSRRWAIALWLLAILIGLARIYVGVHHRIDIIGSVMIGILATGFVHSILKRRGITSPVV